MPERKPRLSGMVAIEPMGIFRSDPTLPASVLSLFGAAKSVVKTKGLVDYSHTFLVSPERWMLDVTNVRQQPGVTGEDVQSLLRILVCAMRALIYADVHFSNRAGVRVGATMVRHRHITPLVAVLHAGTWIDAAGREQLWNLWVPTDAEAEAAGSLGKTMRQAFEALAKCSCKDEGDPLDGAKADHVELAARVLREAGMLK